MYYKLIEGIVYRYNQISQKYPKFKRHALITIASLLVILLGIVIYFVYFAKEKVVEQKQEMITVKVKKAKKEDYKDTYTVMGTIKGAVENEMRFELDGQLASYNYKEGAIILQSRDIGEEVKPGTTLVITIATNTKQETNEGTEPSTEPETNNN